MKCLLCSGQSFEKKSVHLNKKLVSARTQSFRDGLTCSNCLRFACKECLVAFVNKAGKHGKNDPWCSVVKKYILNGLTPTNFVGHCCEWTIGIENRRYDKKYKVDVGGRRYDGYLHVPDFAVLVASQFQCTDVHGFIECAEVEAKTNAGKNDRKTQDSSSKVQYQSHFGPLAHCVIGEEASTRYHKNNVGANGDSGDDLGIFTVNVGSVEDANKMQELKVNIIVFDCVHKEKSKTMSKGRYILDAKLKGRNSPSDAVVRACTLVDTEMMTRYNDEMVDGTIVIGRYNWTEHQSLLCFRWTKPEYIMNLTKLQVIELYKMIMSGISREGYEGRRPGGSGGLTKMDRNFKQFISYPGNLSRQASGCKFIRLEHIWMIIYMSTMYRKKTHGELDERGLEEEWEWEGPGPSNRTYLLLERSEMKAAMVPYSQPVRGGARNIHYCDLQQQPALYNFAEAKAMAAMVLNVLNQRSEFNVHVFAVRYELYSLDRARRYSLLMLNKKLSTREAVLSNYIGENKHTLVQHPVGYHFDYLHRNEPGLENKQLFRCQLYNSQYGMGRGGAGIGNFVFAILDWRHTQSGLRRQIYKQNGGPSNILNQKIWDDFTADLPELRQELNDRIEQQNAEQKARAARRNNNA